MARKMAKKAKAKKAKATNAFIEGTVAMAPTIAVAPGKSDARHPDGHDTDVNSADFSEDDPTPGSAN